MIGVSEAQTLPAPQPSTTAVPAEAGPRPRVLVLLAARNGAPWIREQVDSILAQKAVEVWLAVRDDASTDLTLRELDGFAGNPRVSLLPGPAPTGSAAGNFFALIRENPADGVDFVAFADQDDLWNPDKLCRACRSITAENTAGYSSATVAAWENGRCKTLGLSGAQTRSDYLFEGAGQGCTFVMTVELYARVRQFLAQRPDLIQGLHYHDWTVYALARAWGLRWCFDPEPSMQYRQHAGNDTGARGTLGGIGKRFGLIRQGWYRKQLIGIAELCSAAAPANATVAVWRCAMLQSDGWLKRGQIARFCLRGGRRRWRDNVAVVIAALAGWI